MKIKVKNTSDLILPKNATQYDAGYDIVATSQPAIVGDYNEQHKVWNEIQYIQYHTDLYIEPCFDEKKYHTYIFPRSSISKYRLSLANSIGLIDPGYRGELIVRFRYIPQPSDYKFFKSGMACPNMFVDVNLDTIYKKGDKIAQLVVSETLPVEFEIVETLSDTERDSGGFGSTGA
jgi:dUTPase